MAEIVRIPPRLTAIIKGLSIARRIEARRRIESHARALARSLTERYGELAISHCRKRMVYCARHAPGIRWHIWCRVYHYLAPHSAKPY